jgi:RimJ/RimL family protein N-acetyltransferase
VMRAWRESDLDAFAVMVADEEASRFVGGVATREDAWRSMATHAGHWQLRGYGNWAVERREDGTFLGRVGLWNPEGWPGIEVGWMLARPTWGQGYATECGAAAIAWTWSRFQLPRLLSIIDPRNRRSIAVAERLGMEPLREHVHRGTPVVLYGIDRPARAT